MIQYGHQYRNAEIVHEHCSDAWPRNDHARSTGSRSTGGQVGNPAAEVAVGGGTPKTTEPSYQMQRGHTPTQL